MKIGSLVTCSTLYETYGLDPRDPRLGRPGYDYGDYVPWDRGQVGILIEVFDCEQHNDSNPTVQWAKIIVPAGIGFCQLDELADANTRNDSRTS